MFATLLAPEIYYEIRKTTPTTKEGHGSRHPGKCNVHGCEINGGKEKHNTSMDALGKMIYERYVAITGDDYIKKIFKEF